VSLAEIYLRGNYCEVIMAKKKARSRKLKAESPAKEAFDKAGFTHFGAFVTYDSYLKKWRVVLMAGTEGKGVYIQLAPDVFESESEAKLNAAAVQYVFTRNKNA